MCSAFLYQLRSHRRHFVKFVLCLCLFLCVKCNESETCTKYLVTQWAAVRATWGRISDAPHWNRLNCVPPFSVSSPLSRASIHGNSPNCVKLLSLNIRTLLGFRLPPLTPHESRGGSTFGLGDTGSSTGTSSPSRTSQHTCTPGHALSILCTHNMASARYLADAMVWSQYRGAVTAPPILNQGGGEQWHTGEGEGSGGLNHPLKFRRPSKILPNSTRL